MAHTVGTPGALPATPVTAAYLGQGLTYPPTLNAATGRLMLSSGATSVREAMASIYQTAPNERAMQPDYGANQATFDPETPGLTAARLSRNVADHEPRVSAVTVDSQVGPQYDTQQVEVSFEIVGEATPQVLTYPYFVGPQ